MFHLQTTEDFAAWFTLPVEARAAIIADSKSSDYHNSFLKDGPWWETGEQERARWKEERLAHEAEQEALWRDGKRSKPRWLRKRNTTSGKTYRSRWNRTDTRRTRADGKLLGGHHSRWSGIDDRGSDKHWLVRSERRLGNGYAQSLLFDIDFDQIPYHRSDWGERRFKI